MIAKNLFLRDAKGKCHFLLVTTADRKIDLKALEGKPGSTKLFFASDERLGKYLGLSKGAVSPFGLLNAGFRPTQSSYGLVVVLRLAKRHALSTARRAAVHRFP